MVPVRVRQQDLRLHGAVLALHQLPSQSADARARVEDDQLAPSPSLAPAAALHGDARRIAAVARGVGSGGGEDRKSTRLNSSHLVISYAVFCLKKKKQQKSNHVVIAQELYAWKVDRGKRIPLQQHPINFSTRQRSCGLPPLARVLHGVDSRRVV